MTLNERLRLPSLHGREDVEMTTARELFRLLSPSKRRASTALLGLMLIGMVMETLGISLVFPALTLMTETDLAAHYPALAPWLDRLGNPSQEELAIFWMLTLVSGFAVKTLFLAILGWRQAAFVWGLKSVLSYRLFAGYLRQPYTFHMQRSLYATPWVTLPNSQLCCNRV